MGQTLFPVFPNMWNINSSDTFPVPITNCVCLDFSMSASLKHFQLPSHGFFVSLVGKKVIKLWPLAGGWSEGQSVTGQDKTESSLAKGGSDWIPGKKKKKKLLHRKLSSSGTGCPGKCSDNVWWCPLRTRFSGEHPAAAGLPAGLCNLPGLFQPWWFLVVLFPLFLPHAICVGSGMGSRGSWLLLGAVPWGRAVTDHCWSLKIP